MRGDFLINVLCYMEEIHVIVSCCVFEKVFMFNLDISKQLWQVALLGVAFGDLLTF